MVEEILYELSPMSKTEVVVLIKPTQLAGTTIALIFLCGIAALYPGPTLFMQPTDAMVRSFSKKKLQTAIKHIPELRGKITEQKSRTSANTILQKDFPGGSWLLTGSNSGASYRSESIKNLVLDDFDGFEVDIEGEGSPEELADRRTGSFPGRKVYINSTTTVKDVSNIERAYDKSSQGAWNVPCPHCGTYQPLEWGGADADHGIKFDRDDDGQVIDAWYQCKCCAKRIDEHDKPWMVENGKYVHKYPQRRVRGFKYNALVTPLGWINSWAYIAEKFLEAQKEKKQGNPAKYTTWLNSFMSEPFEESGDRPEWTVLKSRCEPYQMLQPISDGPILTAGVDVQHNRLAVSIYAWGRGEESWLVYHVEIAGDPLHDDVWNQLDQLITRPFVDFNTKIAHHIVSVGVDCKDGNTTQAVRNYCRLRAPRVFALQGANTMGKPIISVPSKQDVTWKGEKIENGVEVWNIGTDTAKSTLYARLKLSIPGPGYIHFYVDTPDEYFKQLTAEKIVTRFVKGYPVREWHNVRGNRRNEALDTWVYAYAAALRAGIAYMNWDKLILTEARPRVNRPKPQSKQSQRQRKW